MDDRRKRALYRAQHRGFKEADILVGRFAEAHLPQMPDDELSAFERLLEVNDHLLYGWILERAAPPVEHDTAVMARLQQFRHRIAQA